jgi:squalene-associated FAD-dependent desaturase
MARSVHIIGAGLSGLAAAVRLVEAGEKVVVHEATAQAGGRCRSYYDHTLGMTIDNGNHLLLSGNHAALSFLRTIGAEAGLVGPEAACFPFVDLTTKERWLLQLGIDRVPWWIFDPARRVPGTGALDYLALVPLLWAGQGKTIGEVINCKGTLHDRLTHPLLLAALNTEPRDSSARLAAAIIRETLAAGGAACRPLIARDGLTSVFIDPALEFLRSRGADIRLEHQLHGLKFGSGRAETLQFSGENANLAANDLVILAVPFWIASSLVGGLRTPSETRAIVNAHFRIVPPAGAAPITGVINGVTEWVFAFEDRLSVTISNADRLLDYPREALAAEIWREVAAVVGIADKLPPWQIVRERRATFAALPEEDVKRPGPRTAWNNLILAGDWTATGLPATIEGAIRSGNRAAEVARSN